jgi:VanZ family protein
VVSFFAGLLYAVSDEIHQYFIPGREMRAFDVFIDSLGVIAGLGLSLVFNNKKPFHHDK